MKLNFSFLCFYQDNQDPLGYALSELLKGQLELTANFLKTQKSLYTNYCASLSKIVIKAEPTSFEKVVHPRKYKEASSTVEETTPEIQEETQYESEFESETSSDEDEDTVVPTTEISVHSNE